MFKPNGMFRALSMRSRSLFLGLLHWGWAVMLRMHDDCSWNLASASTSALFRLARLYLAFYHILNCTSTCEQMFIQVSSRSCIKEQHVTCIHAPSCFNTATAGAKKKFSMPLHICVYVQCRACRSTPTLGGTPLQAWGPPRPPLQRRPLAALDRSVLLQRAMIMMSGYSTEVRYDLWYEHAFRSQSQGLSAFHD